MANTSNAAHSASANSIDSGVPSVPIAMPTVRDTSHTTMTAKLTTIIAWIDRRAGPSTRNAASMTCTHAANPKNRPWVHDTPACSPIAAKWIPAAPSISNAIDHRSTQATEMVRPGGGGTASRPSGRGSSCSSVTCCSRSSVCTEAPLCRITGA